ncbi:Peptidase S8/S53 domain [Sesbania bispinosa]|nr:Peptidase S8/S53 domain [Sesbania bispinosa]
MGMSKKSLSATLFVLFMVFCDISLARMVKKTEDRKYGYIVHVSKSQMPESFNHHSVWYESILKSISNSTEMLYTYNDAIHGFFTRLTTEEARLLKSQIGVLKVFPDKQYKLHTTRTPHFLGLDKIQGTFLETNGKAGSDVIVGLLDTGVWPESKSFNDTGFGPIPSTWKGKCETGTNFSTLNCNKKLIGARYYIKGQESFMGRLNESMGSLSPRDDDGHGTHTASTIAGSPVQNASLFGYANGTARGMAPSARVAMYKVCWNETCAISDILAAIDQAIIDNVNILSISLGGLPFEYYEDPVAIGAFSAMEHGILVSCSAGNAGPEPASATNIAPWMITVGAGTLDGDFPAYVRIGNGQNYSGVSLYNGNPLPDHPLPFIYAGNASKDKSSKISSEYCLKDSLATEKVKGKIVLCDRGQSSRIEKGNIVKSVGGLGMVLANMALEGEELVADAHILPATLVGSKEGNAIKQYLFSNPKSTGTIVFQGTKLGIEPSPVVASFSSRGPNSITPKILKPDLIAPGVNILAAYSRNASPTDLDSDDRRVDFNIISGTSMSCPHVSGLAALIKSAHPDWSPAMIRSALMTTSYTTYKNDQPLLDSANKKPATPFDYGAGHVDPVPALNPGLVYDLTVDDYLSFLCALNYTADNIEAVTRRKYKCDPNKQYSVTDLNYPSFAVVFKKPTGRNGPTNVKHMRTLTNVGFAGTYKVSVKLDIPNVKVSVEPGVLSFKEENEKKSYTITFSGTFPTSIMKPQDGYGFGRLEWSDGKHVVGSPIAVSLG